MQHLVFILQGSILKCLDQVFSPFWSIFKTYLNKSSAVVFYC